MDEELKRIDCNTHILVNPFDEIKTCQESFATLKKVVELGFSKVLLTPRFVQKKDTYATGANLRKQTKELGVAAMYSGVKVELDVASEIFITPNISALVFNGSVLPLEKVKLIIKLPESENVSVDRVASVLRGLVLRHYHIILAAPERSAFLQKDTEGIKKLSSVGAMFLCSYKSIVGMHGRAAEKCMGWMLVNGYCDLLGTEASSVDDEIFQKFPKAEKKILKTIGTEAYEKIMRNADGLF